jgi:(E)-4-hydroxy-3-methylbut-2-enyl-diphosphate synthase
MSFRYFQPLITSCPGCGRTSSKRFQILAKQISDEVNKRLPDWQKKYIGFEKKKISVM